MNFARTAVFDDGFAAHSRKVFSHMFVAILVTAAVSWFISSSPELMASLFHLKAEADGGSRIAPGWIWLVLVLAQLALAFWLSHSTLSKHTTMSASTAYTLFLVYAGLNGVTITPVVAAYTDASVFKAFLASAMVFGGAAAFGYFTKANLLRFGNILLVGLIGLLVVMVVNLFIGSTMMDIIISLVAVALFTVLTAFDIQQQRALFQEQQGQSEGHIAVFGALGLYLNFINIFLHLLRLLGTRSTD